MYRQLYQIGGIGTLPMNFGQPLQVSQPMMNPSFGPMQPMSNSLLNYGQTPLTMAGGGIMRLGYQEGDMAMVEDQAMMQSQMQRPPLEGIMNAMPQEASGMMQGLSGEEQGQTALLTIVQLLIEQGIDPETARELAIQILQAFNQGGAPAVEEFANQLEQQEAQAMALGGIAGYAYRQGYGLGKIVKSVVGGIGSAVKGVASAVKSVVKSPIGMIALSIAAPYAIGAFAPGLASALSLGQTGILGGAIRAGLTNALIQGITTGKINPKQALISAALGGVTADIQGAPTGGINPDVGGIPDVYQPLPTTNLKSGVVPASSPGAGPLFATGADVAVPTVSATPTDLSTYNFSSAAKSVMDPTIGDRFTQGIDYLKSAGTKLMSDPVGTLKTGIGSIYDTVTKTIKENPLLSVSGAFLAGQQFRAPLPGEDPNEYNRLKAEHDAQVAGYITQYGRGAKVYSPGEYGLYAREKAIDPFAGLTTYAADGGRIGYAEGTSFEKQSLIKKGYGDMIKNMSESEILKLYDSVMGTFTRRFQAEGTMPMGEPRRNPAGIMELDYRKEGGFVPPIGIKEKADDIPAMLSNNEFVFTADAVRNAGDGNVNRGAQRMYSLMKSLEAGGRV
jgi:hypothetical protein